jgi:Skp family chaperone for outer membrane proteins
MGFVLGLGLKALGFGKMLLGWIWDTICGIFKFAVEKPFQFLTIVLALGLVIAGCFAFNTKKELVATQGIVNEKVTFIKSQDKILKEYVKALEVEKTNHVKDIKKSNVAVSNIKQAADRALANAKAEGIKAGAKKQQYLDLANKYSTPNSSQVSDAQRIKNEEETNRAFIKDWRKAK